MTTGLPRAVFAWYGPSAVLAIVVLLLGACSKPKDRDGQPYARWRNGIIVHVRNCTAPTTETQRLQCASLYCAQAATRRLTNAQQATLSIAHYERDPVTGHIEVTGALDQLLRAPTLPTGFTCSMDDFRRAEPKFVFGRRNAQDAASPLLTE